MTVTANVEFGLMARKVGRAERAKKVAHMLKVMQIDEKAHSYPHELSGGQKQRVALARACVIEPSVLLLDEPFSNLDTSLRDVMREFVSNLQRDLGITTILVTHDKEEAFMLSQRVAVVLDGHVRQFDTPWEIYSHPRTIQVADFIGEANYIGGAVRDGSLSCFFGDFDAGEVPDGEARLMLRYDQLLIDKNSGTACQIIEKRYRGGVTTYRITIDAKQWEYSPHSKQEPTTSPTLYVNSPDSTLNPGDTTFIKVAKEAGWVLTVES
jgi:iron(III) transport system ATP-binding protein